jgi:hypothetical protein
LRTTPPARPMIPHDQVIASVSWSRRPDQAEWHRLI